MFNRIVSISSLLLAIASVLFFGLSVWWLLVGAIGQLEGVFTLCGWLLTAGVFAYRFTDPAWLEPVSIVKA